MRWNWLRDKSPASLRVFWEKGLLNDTDYFTKHHPPKDHRQMRPRYILSGHNVSKKSNITGSARVHCSPVQSLPVTSGKSNATY